MDNGPCEGNRAEKFTFNFQHGRFTFSKEQEIDLPYNFNYPCKGSMTERLILTHIGWKCIMFCDLNVGLPCLQMKLELRQHQWENLFSI